MQISLNISLDSIPATTHAATLSYLFVHSCLHSLKKPQLLEILFRNRYTLYSTGDVYYIEASAIFCFQGLQLLQLQKAYNASFHALPPSYMLQYSRHTIDAIC